jgi:hypothetical protein
MRYKYKRNLEIIGQRMAGESFASIARTHNISGTRCFQIFKRYVQKVRSADEEYLSLTYNVFGREIICKEPWDYL